ncbi:MAG: ABC transporter ATP-binding protein [Acidimicrobiales bacterium]
MNDALVPKGASVWRPALAMLHPYRKSLALAFATLLGSLGATLAGPALVSYALNHGLVHHHDLHVVEVAGAAYLAVAAAFFVFTRAQTRMFSGTGELVLNDLRKRVFNHLVSQSLEFFDAESSGQLLTRMTADIDVLESLVQSGIGSFLTSVGLFFTSLVVLAVMSPILFGVTLACLAPVLVAAARYRVSSSRAYRAVRLRIGDTLATLDEGLAGVRVVQAFRQERRMEHMFHRRNTEQLEATLETARIATFFFPKVEGTGVVTTALLLLVGGFFVHLGLTSVGAVAAFVLYTSNLFGAVNSVSQLFDLLQSSGAALSTVFTLLGTDMAMKSPIDPVPLPSQGELVLSHVSFAYRAARASDAEGGKGEGNCGGGDRSVLSGVNLTIEPGEHLVLVGPTGAGKSTLAKLIGRLYDPIAGSVRFGGVDLRQASLDDLRRRIVVVPQEGFLFRGTVLDNIRIGRPEASEEEVMDVLRRLGSDRHLLGVEGGLQAQVGERGSRLSAGERQLVSLGRAALMAPAALVLDEATSSLDPGTELEVEQAVAALSADRTTVTVAHRLSTAQRADRVAVVMAGRVVEVGPHDELVAKGGHYAALFRAWAAGAVATGGVPAKP